MQSSLKPVTLDLPYLLMRQNLGPKTSLKDRQALMNEFSFVCEFCYSGGKLGEGGGSKHEGEADQSRVLGFRVRYLPPPNPGGTKWDKDFLDTYDLSSPKQTLQIQKHVGFVQGTILRARSRFHLGLGTLPSGI